MSEVPLYAANPFTRVHGGVLGVSQGCGRFLMGEVPLYPAVQGHLARPSPGPSRGCRHRRDARVGTPARTEIWAHHKKGLGARGSAVG